MDDTNERGERHLLPLPPDGPWLEGTPVEAADGEVLGTVGAHAGDRFKINAPLAPDYWLPKSAIAGMAPGGDLVVSLPSDEIDDAKIPGPEEA
jgi:hypothetical protein